MRGYGAALATVVAVGFVTANAVAVLATVAWVSSGTGLYAAGALERTTVLTILVATLLGTVAAGLVARGLRRPVTPAMRVSTAAGAAAYALATALLLTFGGALATGLVVLIAGPVVAAVTSLLVVRRSDGRPDGRRR